MRVEAEDQLQVIRQQLSASQIFQRQKEMELQSLTRENRAMQGSLQMIQQGVIEGVNEINIFKEQTQNAEREKYMLKSTIEQQQMQLSQSEHENQRVKQALERERDERTHEYTRMKEAYRDLESKLERV